MFNIDDELKKLPTSPGVYIMHDADDAIIYVGKAINLRNRVRQYFRESTAKSVKIVHMVSHIDHFEYIVTDSELEALILENNLIKENRPKYNTMLRDDKTYPYIKVTIKEAFPRIMMTRRIIKDHARYFGPFSSGYAVRESIDLLRKVYKIRSCNKKIEDDIYADRPCLDYHMHQCDAPCMGYITKDDYRHNVDLAISCLSGDYKEVISMLESEMKSYSDEMDYERAAIYRDLIESIKHVTQHQKITASKIEDRDIVALARNDKEAVIQIFFIREGKMVGKDHRFIDIEADDTDMDIIESFVKLFYAGTPYIPSQIWLQQDISDRKIIEKWLSQIRGASTEIIIPQKGDKEKLVELAARNAKIVLDNDRDRIKLQKAKDIASVHELEKALSIHDIHRIEAYDISNISGVEAVGSMVVYEDGAPKKSDYRKFRIKSIIGSDDYGSLREVLLRRLNRTILSDDTRFGRLPDLILMDGGKGQVNVAKKVIQELGIDICICGMVKDDRHRTRGIYYNDKEILNDEHSSAFRLVTRIQDEAHRFAIEYHRSLRQKTQVRSILDDIDGIGSTRRRSLMRYFKDIDAIRNATIEELNKADSMNEKAAIAVYQYFHKDGGNV